MAMKNGKDKEISCWPKSQTSHSGRERDGDKGRQTQD